jgi:hypothetical protein
MMLMKSRLSRTISFRSVLGYKKTRFKSEAASIEWIFILKTTSLLHLQLSTGKYFPLCSRSILFQYDRHLHQCVDELPEQYDRF